MPWLLPAAAAARAAVVATHIRTPRVPDPDAVDANLLGEVCGSKVTRPGACVPAHSLTLRSPPTAEAQPPRTVRGLASDG